MLFHPPTDSQRVGSTHLPETCSTPPHTVPPVESSPSQVSQSPASSPAPLPTQTTPQISADFYQAAVLNAGIPVVALDATGRILSWNHTAVRMFGRSEAEVLGRPLEILIPSEFRPIASRAFQRTIQQHR